MRTLGSAATCFVSPLGFFWSHAVGVQGARGRARSTEAAHLKRAHHNKDGQHGWKKSHTQRNISELMFHRQQPNAANNSQQACVGCGCDPRPGLLLSPRLEPEQQVKRCSMRTSSRTTISSGRTYARTRTACSRPAGAANNIKRDCEGCNAPPILLRGFAPAGLSLQWHATNKRSTPATPQALSITKASCCTYINILSCSAPTRAARAPPGRLPSTL